MIRTKMSKDGMYAKGWYVYLTEQDKLMVSEGFEPRAGDWELVGYRRLRMNAKRLANRAKKDRKEGWK
jgi:hypothetical protein